MRHLTSPVLRRLADEPLAVADAARGHLEGCARCQAASAAAAADAELAARALAAPPLDPDADRAWARLQDQLRAPAGGTVRRPARQPRYARRGLARLSVGTGTALAAGLVAVGAGAAVAISTVYTPTRVAPVPVTQQDLTTIASIARLGGSGLDGLPPSGTRQLPFGELTWSSAGAARQVSSAAAARALAHVPVTEPARLPAGVGHPAAFMVQPQVTATIKFGAAAGPDVGGSTLVITAGPGILVRYASADGQPSPPALVVAVVRRPAATSTGASASQLEHFLLTRSGLPAGLADELRLLGTTTLPVPVPAGVPSARVQIGGSPGVLVADPSGAAAGVVWESRDGLVHGAAGLLDRKDILDVASQLG